ncbi:hypothetical protein KJ969_00520 [Patescibacteria group bacterium]|nr:hypothetical protein [Patescibacteria group bacterium]MBU1922475.1 hypothetical protein [Patescibacteria group bacterium]
MSTLYSVGLMNQLGDALEKAGYTSDDVTKLRSSQEILGRALDALHGRAKIVPADPSEFPVFKTIKLGTGPKTGDELFAALKGASCEVSEFATDMLGKNGFAVASEQTEVELVVASVGELGFPKGATRREIYERAKELGLELCPPEVGPQLRLQYPDQPNGEWLLIAMEPIADSDGDPSVFRVGHDDGGRWLYGGYGDPGRRWGAGSRWVFVRRK